MEAKEAPSALSAMCIEVRGARTLNLSGVDFSIPHRAITAITGPAGSGKTAAAVYTVYNESRRMLSSVLRVADRRRTTLDVHPQADSISGLLPAVNISEVSRCLAVDLPLAGVIGLRQLLVPLVMCAGHPRCQRKDCGMESATPAETAERVMNYAAACGRENKSETFPAQGETQSERRESVALVSALFPQMFLSAWAAKDPRCASLRKEQSLSRLVAQLARDFALQGYRRFVVDGQLVKLSEELAARTTDDFEDYLVKRGLLSAESAATEKRGFAVVIDSLPLCEGVKERLCESLETAIKLGLGISSVDIVFAECDAAMENSRLNGPRWVSTEGYHCPVCSRDFPRLDLQRTAELLAKLDTAEDDIVASLFNGEASSLLRATVSQASEFLAEFAAGKSGVSSIPAEMEGPLSRFRTRLEALLALGLGYLPLDTPASAFSSGEQLKVALANYCFDEVTETLFILDEPSRVLHPEDLQLLFDVLRQLVRAGNTVLLVDRDQELVSRADHVVALARHVWSKEAFVAFEGRAKEWVRRYAEQGVRRESVRKPSSSQDRGVLVIREVPVILAHQVVRIPTRCIAALTGRSGTGKTVIMRDVIFSSSRRKKSSHFTVEGLDAFRQVDYLAYDIGPARRGHGRRDEIVLASEIAASSAIAKLFSSLPMARRAGLSPDHFAIEKSAGRCELCHGTGVEIREFDFLGSAEQVCDRCSGRRFKSRVLEVKYGEYGIDAVYEMEVKEVFSLFASRGEIISRLEHVLGLGLGHVRLGQVLRTMDVSARVRLDLARTLSLKRTRQHLLLVDQGLDSLSPDDLDKCFVYLSDAVRKEGSIIIACHAADLLSRCDEVVTLSR